MDGTRHYKPDKDKEDKCEPNENTEQELDDLPADETMQSVAEAELSEVKNDGPSREKKPAPRHKGEHISSGLKNMLREH